jgi:flavin reductase (DIM6/NTAB) family NADH-FMN oxidoreductase RutF
MLDAADAAPLPQQLRLALGRFATGVTIVTCRDRNGTAMGLTANSFSGVSLEPPLVLWSLRRASPSLPEFAAARHFNVNVLAEGQVDLSRRFASAVPDKFAEGLWTDGATGVPMLAGCAAVFECETIARHDVGDHLLFIGRVLSANDSALPPLVFQSGHYHMLGEVV